MASPTTTELRDPNIPSKPEGGVSLTVRDPSTAHGAYPDSAYLATA